MSWGSKLLVSGCLALVIILTAGTSQAALPDTAIDTLLAKQEATERPCAVCHTRPDFGRLNYDRWTSLIKLVPQRMMPVKGTEEKTAVLRAIKTGESNGFYRSRCSNCHAMPDPSRLRYSDWKGRLYQLEGLEMPVMSADAKQSVLADLAAANGRKARYDVTDDWFERPETRRTAPLPDSLKALTENNALLVHFWSPGCEPCREELPEFKGFVSSIPDTVPLTVRIIATTTKRQETRRLLNPIAEGRLIFDSEKTLTNRLKVGSFPTNYLVGRDGKFLARMVGSRPWDQARFRNELYRLIHESPAATDGE